MSPSSLQTPDTAVQDCLAALRKQVSGELRTDMVNRLLYSTDASIYQVMPYGVLLPETAEDIHADRKSTRLNSSHSQQSRMPSSA